MSDYQFIFEEVKNASKSLLGVSNEKANQILNDLSDLTIEQSGFLIAENRRDLARMDDNNPMKDRLLLSQERIEGISEELRNVASLPSPIHQTIEEKEISNGLKLKKVTVPLGVIGIVYEARPNVTFDVFALALKSGNALVLKGGSDAEFSNLAIMILIHRVLDKHGINKEAFQLLPSERAAATALLSAVEYVDAIIPRGSQSLISHIREHSRVPVIETGAGIVHTYLDERADLEKARNIILNAKTRRPSVCNSLDCLILHRSHLGRLEYILDPLLDKGVQIFADQPSLEALPANSQISEAHESHYGTEFLSLKLAIKTVNNFNEALQHIDLYSSKHSEAIISEDEKSIDQFLLEVDSAAVYVNTSTAFTDGAQFGLGAEIGISTQKLHARGPMGLKELCSYKWQIIGQGQIRE